MSCRGCEVPAVLFLRLLRLRFGGGFALASARFGFGLGFALASAFGFRLALALGFRGKMTSAALRFAAQNCYATQPLRSLTSSELTISAAQHLRSSASSQLTICAAQFFRSSMAPVCFVLLWLLGLLWLGFDLDLVWVWLWLAWGVVELRSSSVLRNVVPQRLSEPQRLS